MGSADDYLVSPPVNFDKNKQYQLRYTYSTANWVDDAGQPVNEKMKIYYGRQSSPEGMTTLIKDLGEFHTSSGTYLYGKDTFTPESEGIGYIGFLACSDANRGKIFLKDISIREYSTKDVSVEGFTGSATVNRNVPQTYTVDVANEGSAPVKGYLVQIVNAETGEVLGQKEGPAIERDGSAAVAVDWTPQTEGEMKVAARAVLDGDTYPADNLSKKTITVEVAATDAEKYVTLNEKTTYGWAFPFYLSFKYYQGQCIYLEREMQKKNIDITGMRLHYDGHDDNSYTFPARVYMKQTDMDNLSVPENPYMGMFEQDGWTKVYDGNITVGGTDTDTELTIKFDNNFKYENGNVNIKFEIPFHSNVLSTDRHPDWYLSTDNAEHRSASFRSDKTDIVSEGETYVYDSKPYLQLSYSDNGASGIFAVGTDGFAIEQRGLTMLLSETATKAEVFTLSGKTVYVGKNIKKINLSGMAKGIYLLRATVGDKTENLKFVVK